MDYSTLVDSIEKDLGFIHSEMNTNALMKARLSSGQLVTDLIMGGGYLHGLCTIFGQEASAKSTDLYTLIISAINSEIPVIAFFDYEGTTDPKYFGQMLKDRLTDKTITDVFGTRDLNGNIKTKGRIHYYDPDVAEDFFRWIRRLLSAMPDKRIINGVWYDVHEDTKENRAEFAGNYSTSLLKRYKKICIESKNAAQQALVMLDSYPAMLPEIIDDTDKSKGVALQARMFSDELKKFVSKLKKKHVLLVGTNQIRLKPMTMFANPEYEPGGNALKFYSRLRKKNTPRAVPHGKSGQIENETSVFDPDKEDSYRYIHSKIIKNKSYTPFYEGWARIWVKDHLGNGHGYDLVWDTFEYFKMTKQITGTMKKFTLKIDGELEASMSFLEFKKLVLYYQFRNKDKLFEVTKKIFGTRSGPVNLRGIAQEQLDSGLAHKLFV
jgi:RecA/RadA recombinase